MEQRIPLYQINLAKQLNDFSFFDIGSGKVYWKKDQPNQSQAKELLTAILQQSEKGVVALLLDEASILYLQEQETELMNQLKKSVSSKSIRLIGSTAQYCLVALISKKLLSEQIKRHQKLLIRYFDYKADYFMLPLAMYYDAIVDELKAFKSVLIPYSPWHFANAYAGQTFVSAFNEKLCINAIVQEANHLQIVEPIGEKKAAQLSSPELLAINVSDYIGQPLQKEYLTQLKRIHQLPVFHSSYSENAYLLAQLADYIHFKQLQPNAISPYNYFISLMNILTDWEQRLET